MGMRAAMIGMIATLSLAGCGQVAPTPKTIEGMNDGGATKLLVPGLSMQCGVSGNRIQVTATNRSGRHYTCSATCSYTENGNSGTLQCGGVAVPNGATNMVVCWASGNRLQVTNPGTHSCS